MNVLVIAFESSRFCCHLPAAMVCAFALIGCATTGVVKPLPQKWEAASANGDCSSVMGDYVDNGEGVGDIPQFTELQQLPKKAALASLLTYGEDRPTKDYAKAVRIQRDRQGRFQFVLLWFDGRETLLAAEELRWNCSSGRLTSKWTDTGTGTGGVWVHETRTISVYRSVDGALIVSSDAVDRQAQPILLIPVYSQEHIRFYWRFPTVGATVATPP